MKKPSTINIRILVTASLAVCSISNVMADNLDSAANKMFDKLKLNPQPAQPQPNMPQSPMTMPPMPQGPGPIVPPEFMPPPTGTMLPGVTPTNTSQQPAFAVPPEFMPEAITASNGAVAIPAASLEAPNTSQPMAGTVNDGSIPLPAVDYPNNTQYEPDVSEGTEGEGTEGEGISDGNVAPLT